MNSAKLRGESVREFYRRQGEQRMAELLISELNALLEHRPAANWSPRYLISLIEAKAAPEEIQQRSIERLSA
jgi:hypothetical protein